MNLEQFEPEVRERIEEHLSKYSHGQLLPNTDDETLPEEVLLINADTIKEAKAIMETAVMMEHFSEWIPSCGCAHDCCAHTFSTYRGVKRVGTWQFLAQHRMAINV